MSLHAVILAGGSGTRFWPLSRRDHPKQFLKIINQRSLFQGTIERIFPLVPASQIWIVSNLCYQKHIIEQQRTYGIPSAQFLYEPWGKNTAPAIAWAASLIHQRDPESVMIVLPSDHLIQNKPAFWKCLKQALSLARYDFLVTLGIVPTRPEIGYGYLRIKSSVCAGQKISKVVQFTEKPAEEKARMFLRSGKYLWNSGIFIWKTSVFRRAVAEWLPDVFRIFAKPIAQNEVKRIWSKLPAISVDYGVLEKAKNVATVPAGEIRWTDLGSWQALYEVLKKDKDGNAGERNMTTVDCQNLLVKIQGQKKVRAFLGLKDLIVVDTPDALLICRRDQSQRVKEIVQQLQGRYPAVI